MKKMLEYSFSFDNTYFHHLFFDEILNYQKRQLAFTVSPNGGVSWKFFIMYMIYFQFEIVMYQAEPSPIFIELRKIGSTPGYLERISSLKVFLFTFFICTCHDNFCRIRKVRKIRALHSFTKIYYLLLFFTICYLDTFFKFVTLKASFFGEFTTLHVP